jgi:hypothetical protein
MSMNNSTCKKEKDYRKSSILHHMESSHCNDEDATTGWASKEQGWHHHQKHHHTKLPTHVKDEPTPFKSTNQADLEGKCDNIIKVINTRGATIKVSISEIDRCTRGIT